ncbi:MAG: histidine kinase [Ginsengibacter sp.]
MIKDTWLRAFIIPALGIIISYISGIISYEKYSKIEVTGGCLYFILVSYCIWRGCQWVHIKLRSLYTIQQNPFSKIMSVCAISGVYGSAVAGIFCLLWMQFSREVFDWNKINQFIILSVLAILLFTLFYEVLYLSKERKMDNKIVTELDHELARAELTALKNQLDPHFIFNSLNTLSHLINHDVVKADLFNNKLAQVYRYFLINKDKELIAAESELEFIKNYCFLLQIRHDDKLILEIDLDKENTKNLLIVPCAMQLLVENAIKHNQFTEQDPLRILVSMSSEYLSVENPVKQKQVLNDSTKVGLKNLSAQYRMIAKKNIIIENNPTNFIVKLPLITTNKKVFA